MLNIKIIEVMGTKKEEMEREASLARMDALTKDMEGVIPEDANVEEVVVVCVNIIAMSLYCMDDRERALRIAARIPRAVKEILEMNDGKVSDDEGEEE